VLIAERCHATTFLLDPRFRNMPVESEDYVDCETLLRKYVPSENWSDFQSVFENFRNERGPFQGVAVSDLTHPVTFWRRFLSIRNTQLLARIAVDLSSLPGSCASVERSFSAVRRIHTWQRNRLGREKLAKLVYVYINRRILAKEEL